ncbi:hypothetical protein B0H63DRAFT_446267 [Podospora didyma]|uniref:Uncharacterized protein n=1 Tax=Podospora didyma TaxID=330526 RepID=A0AAE0NYR7_9PEZI|nr:hypothetical protein B0H63DRAFT_446267 [Podospora didyma]
MKQALFGLPGFAWLQRQSTQTDVITATELVTVSKAAFKTLVSTVIATTALPPVARRFIASLFPAYPNYASGACPSWEKYVSACQCVGVFSTTITVDARATTITEQSPRLRLRWYL